MSSLDLIDPVAMNSRYTKEQLVKLVSQNPSRWLADQKRLVVLAHLAFPQLHEPKGIVDPKTGKTSDPKFGAMLIMAPGYDLTGGMTGWLSMCEEYWPKNPKGQGFMRPFKEQSTKINVEDGGSSMKPTMKGMIKGGFFMTPNANPDYPPELYIYRGGKPELFRRDDPAKIQQEFYPGCWVLATISFFKGNNNLNPGVFPSLGSVTKILDDNKFSGGGSENVGQAFEGFKLDASLDLGSNFDSAAGGIEPSGAADEDPLAAFYN